MSDIIHVTATGFVLTQGHSAIVQSITLTPAAAVANVVLRDFGATGTIKTTLQAAANGGSIVWIAGDAKAGPLFTDGVHVTLTGAGATVEIELSQQD